MEYDGVNAADMANVDHRIGVEKDEVRQLADSDGAGLVLAAQEPGGRDRRRLECFHWGQPRLDEQSQLVVQTEACHDVLVRRIGPCQHSDPGANHPVHELEALPEQLSLEPEISRRDTAQLFFR